LAAFRADVLSALARIFVEGIFARHRAWAKGRGLVDAPSGAVLFVQRFGSSVNLNVHFHVIVLDGVFRRDVEAPRRLSPDPPPTREELDHVAGRARRRAVAWLERHGDLARAQEDGGATDASTPLDACATIAMQRGQMHALRDDPDHGDDPTTALDAAPRTERAVEHDGFNLEASVCIPAHDDLGRERRRRPLQSISP
jgi:hypothetical protein